MAVAAEVDARAGFVEFFSEGWATGATDPERFFEHFGARLTPDALMRQPLARDVRGAQGMRELFSPLFQALPDLRGETVRWGPTDDGVIIEIALRSPSTGIAWTSIDVIELRDGLIAARTAHFDPLPLMLAVLRRPRVAAKILPSLFKR